MAAIITDISKAGSVIKVTIGTDQPKGFVNRQVKFFFDSAGANFYINFGKPDESWTIPIANLTIQTAAPANAAAGYTAMSANIFP